MEAREISSIGHAEYLERSGIVSLLEDAVQLMLARREERPIEFMSNYLYSAIMGDNVSAKDYAYINSSQRNRLALVASFQRTFHDNFCDQGRLWPPCLPSLSVHSFNLRVVPLTN